MATIDPQQAQSGSEWRLALWLNLRHRVRPLFLMLYGLAVALVVLALVQDLLRAQHLTTFAGSVLAALSLGAAVFLLVAYGLPFYRARAARRDPRARHPTTVQFDEAGVHITSAISNIDLSWAAFVKFGQHPRLLLLYQTPRRYLYFSRRHYPADEWAEMLRLAANHLPEIGVNEDTWHQYPSTGAPPPPGG